MACFSCSNCFNSNHEKLGKFFDSKTKQGRKPLLILIFNTILNLDKTYSDYCFCKNQWQCFICAAAACFKDCQYGVYQHSLEFNSSNLVLVDQLLVLKKFLPRNDQFVSNLINNPFYYSCDNWFWAKNQFFSIEQCLIKWESTIEHLNRTNSRHYIKKWINCWL